MVSLRDRGAVPKPVPHLQRVTHRALQACIARRVMVDPYDEGPVRHDRYSTSPVPSRTKAALDTSRVVPSSGTRSNPLMPLVPAVSGSKAV